MRQRMVTMAVAALALSLCFAAAAGAVPDLTDNTVAQFTLGDLSDADCAVTPSAGDGGVDGELILTPTIDETFAGDALPAGWSSGLYSGAAPVVSGGLLSVESAYAYTDNTFTPSRVLEFVAIFSGVSGQHVGFAFNESLISDEWALFSTVSGDQLYARTKNTSDVQVGLGASYLGAPHRYRIEWTATSVIYAIDGVTVHTETGEVFSSASHVTISDFPLDSAVLAVDWVRMGDYPASPASCTFVSRVLDSEVSGAEWVSVTSSTVLPAGTSVSFGVRASDTNPPTGAFTSAPGGTLPDNAVFGRYAQYEVTLSTTGAAYTPEVRQVVLNGITPTAVALDHLGAQANGLSSAPLLVAAGIIGLGVISGVLIRRRK